MKLRAHDPVRTTGDPAAAATALNRRADVEYAEVDRPTSLFATPNDPRYPELYGLDNTGQTAARRTPTSTPRGRGPRRDGRVPRDRRCQARDPIPATAPAR